MILGSFFCSPIIDCFRIPGVFVKKNGPIGSIIDCFCIAGVFVFFKQWCSALDLAIMIASASLGRGSNAVMRRASPTAWTAQATCVGCRPGLRKGINAISLKKIHRFFFNFDKCSLDFSMTKQMPIYARIFFGSVMMIAHLHSRKINATVLSINLEYFINGV